MRELKPLKLPVIELCKIQGGDKVSLCGRQVTGVKKRKVTLPPLKTPQSIKLLEILKKNDIYEEYTVLSTRKLRTIHENDKIEEESLRDISLLIPVTETYYLYPSQSIASKREQVEKDGPGERYREGYEEGYETGKEDGFRESEVEQQGYENGYESGYAQGREDEEDERWGPEDMGIGPDCNPLI